MIAASPLPHAPDADLGPDPEPEPFGPRACFDEAEAADTESAAEGADAGNDRHFAAPAPRSAALLPLDDAQLAAWIAAIGTHDERALSALYDATVSRIYGLVLRILRRAAWAEEVVEDTYFQVWRQALRFDPGRGKPLTWLMGMARSRAIDALRREARFEHVPLDGDGAAEVEDAGPAAADDWLASVQGQARLHRALAALSAQPRQLVALAFFRGLSHEEIAEQTALPLGTVKSQIRRALIALRATLDEAGLRALPA